MIREETHAFKWTRITETAAKLFFGLDYEATKVGWLSQELGVAKPLINSCISNLQEILKWSNASPPCGYSIIST